MKKYYRLFIPIFTLGLTLVFSTWSSAQVRVVVDNHFNQETNQKTGKPFHYLWTDTENSGFSQWGDLFKAQGAEISTLREAPTASNLKEVGIYIIVDPDTTSENPNPNYISKSDIKVIVKWVKKGGVLLLMANDGPNCEFTHFNHLASEFGMHFNHVTLNHVEKRNWNMGAITSFSNNPIFKGVSKIYMKDVASISISGTAKPVLVKDGAVFMAESKIGKGYVLAVGDPWIYNEYIDHAYLPQDFENLKAAKNLTSFLISKVQ